MFSPPFRRVKEAARRGRIDLRLSAWIVLLVGMATVAMGCGRKLEMTEEWPVSEYEPTVKLQPGDEIQIRFREVPELDETQTIRPDGKISLQLIDEVVVANLTPEEVDAKLTKLYENDLVNPVLTVIVRRLDNAQVFVLGSVKNSGPITMSGRLTLLEAIGAAGGLDETSAHAETTIIIRHEGNRRFARLVDLEVALSQPESEPFYLAPRDVIIVPEKKIVSINRWIDQYINQMIPSNAAIGLVGINNRR